jgi:hypothetical protein
VTTITKSDDNLLPEMKETQETDYLATELRLTLVDVSIADESQWRSIDEALTYGRRIFLTAALRSRVARLFDDNPGCGHYGSQKTSELVSGHCHCPVMDSEIRKYVAGCELCHRIKAPPHARYGLNMPLSPPSRPWEGLTIDFVIDLPVSTASGDTGMMAIVDGLTTMVIYLPWRQEIDSQEIARMFFKHVIC